MIDNKIVFDSVSEILDSNFIYKLGEEFCPTFEDKPLFIIKTRHIENEVNIVDDIVKTIPRLYEDIMIMKVFKCANGYLSAIDGHMGSDFNGYEIYEIAKLSF